MSKTQNNDLGNTTPIEKTSLVDPKNRSKIFVDLFKNYAVKAESLIYGWMNRLSQDYKGGYWNIFKLSNVGFYMSPKTESDFTVECFGFGCSVKMSADAAGLTATLFAVNFLANDLETDEFINLYYLIRDFASQHPESSKIFKAID